MASFNNSSDSKVAPPAYSDLFRERGHSTSYASSNPIPTRSDQPRSNATEQIERSHSDENDQILKQALEFTHHDLKQSFEGGALDRSIVIPQVGSGFGMPFARGYSDSLREQGVSIDEFLEFIDNYNIVSGGSPPFAILDLAGGVVGFIPMGHAQIISGALSGVAMLGQVGMNAINKNRATKFLEESNANFFTPRGLKVEIATSKAVKSRLGMNVNTPLALPAEESNGLSVHERRMAALSGYAAPLTFDVPPPNEQTATLKRMAAAQQKIKLQRQEKKALKDREKYAEKKVEAEQKIGEKSSKVEKENLKLEKERDKVMNKHSNEVAKIEKEFEKEARKNSKDIQKAEKKRSGEMAKKDRDLQSELSKLEKERQKLDKEYNEEAEKETKGAQKDDKEMKASEKILWILVEKL